MSTLDTSLDSLWTAQKVMRLLGYKSTSAFWVFVHASGFPCIRINGRRIMFHRAALEDWLRQRAVGKHSAPIVVGQNEAGGAGGE